MMIDMDYWGAILPDHEEYFVAVDQNGSVYAYSSAPLSGESEWVPGGAFLKLGGIGDGPGDQFDTGYIEDDDGDEEIIIEGWDENYFCFAPLSSPTHIEYCKLQATWMKRMTNEDRSLRLISSEHLVGLGNTFPELGVGKNHALVLRPLSAHSCRTSRNGIIMGSHPSLFAIPYYYFEIDTEVEIQNELRKAAAAVG